MRFISKYANYSICYQIDVTNYFGDGNSQLVKPLLNCQFRLMGMNEWESKAARERFIHRGLGTYEDHVTLEDPANRFSVFDTLTFQIENRLTDEVRKDIEQFLLNRWENGSDYIMVSKPATPAPWPSYDDFRGVRGMPTAQRIAEKVSEDGYEVAAVIAYERENANRQDVIDALEALSNTPVAEEENSVVVVA